MAAQSVGRMSTLGAALSLLLVWQASDGFVVTWAGQSVPGAAKLGVASAASPSVSSSRSAATAVGAAPADGSRFVPVPLRKIMDTRTGAGGVGVGPVAARSTVSFRVAGVAGVPRSGATAVVLHLTAIRPVRSGVLVAFPAGTPRPSIVSASFNSAESVTSLVVVRPGVSRRGSVYNGSRGATHLRADVIGYFAPSVHAPAGSVHVAVPATRIMDTRTGSGGVPVRPVPARRSVSFPVAGPAADDPNSGLPGVPSSGVRAVVLHVTVIRPKASGALVGYPAGTTRPGIVSASFSAAENVTATMLIRPGQRLRASVYNSSAGATHMRVDVLGYFAAPTDPPSGSELVPVAPRRILDTRTGAGGALRAPVRARGIVSFPVLGVAGVPSPRVTAVLAHLTAIRPTSSGALVAYPAGSLLRPVVVSAAMTGGEIVTSTVLLRPGATGWATIYNASRGGVHVRVDVVGFFRPVPPGWTARVSVASNGTEANGASIEPPVLAGNGRYVAFASDASNLVPADANGAQDVFVHSRVEGTTIRVSVASNGGEASTFSRALAISANGRYVVFDSPASNLVDADGNNTWDVFVHDRETAQTTRVSLTTAGSEANGPSAYAAMSGDGRYVAFSSHATNLVHGDRNGREDVFVHDRVSGATTRVSVASDGTEANEASVVGALSADGRYVAFSSGASNLVVGDTNGAGDGFVHDRLSGTTTRVTVSSDGTQGDWHSDAVCLSADGRYVAFNSHATNLVAEDANASLDVFVHDRATGATTRVSVASDGSEAERNDRSHSAINRASMSADGRHVSFQSGASNLVPGDLAEGVYVYVHDRASAATTRVSVGVDGTVQNGSASWTSSISDDGRYVAFGSAASNLVAGDTNNGSDIFIRERD